MNTQKDVLDFLTQRGFAKCINTLGGEDAPIAFSDFRETCKDYRVEKTDD